MSSPPRDLSSFLPESATDPRAAEPGYNLVVVPRAGLAACSRYDDLAAMLERLSAAHADPDTCQVFAFGLDGRHYPVATDFGSGSGWVLLPRGPVRLGPEPSPPAEFGDGGLTPGSVLIVSAASPVVSVSESAGGIPESDPDDGFGDTFDD